MGPEARQAPGRPARGGNQPSKLTVLPSVWRGLAPRLGPAGASSPLVAAAAVAGGLPAVAAAAVPPIPATARPAAAPTTIPAALAMPFPPPAAAATAATPSEAIPAAAATAPAGGGTGCQHLPRAKECTAAQPA